MKKTMQMVIVGMLVGGLVGCNNTAADTNQTLTSTQENEVIATSVSFTPSNSDLDDSWDESATKIKLADGASTIDGSGALVEENKIVISEEGTYVISGTLTNGRIVIQAEDTAKVHLVLENVDITNLTGAPISAESGDKVIITLAEGSVNTLRDGGENFVYDQVADEEPNAAVFAKCDLTFNGLGRLNISAGFNNGITTKDDLVIINGDYQITAANHAIRGKDSVVIMDGSFDLTAKGDGIQTSNDTDPEKGWMILEAGDYVIDASDDGIQAETTLLIDGGTYQITAGDGYLAEVKETETTGSSTGINATTSILINQGSFTIDSQADSFHTSGELTIHNGTFTIESGDDAMHADEKILITNGQIDIVQSYEGIEAADIVIQGGIINIFATDDGINAAGSDETTTTEPGFNRGGDYSITIEGGKISIITNCDGIDSNGTLTVSGGSVISLIDTREGGSGGVDCDGDFTVTGGTVIYGGTSTGNSLSSSSSQSYIYLASEIQADSLVSLMKDGEVVVSFTPQINLMTLSITDSKIVADQVYDLYVNDSLVESITAGVGGGMSMGGRGQRPSGEMGQREGMKGGEFPKEMPAIPEESTEPITN